jgi:hypothetical protein
MDKAIIFGVFDFVSFHVCKSLLNKGLVVNGVHIEEMNKIHLLDDKRLEVGRNSNFSEKSLFEWVNDRGQDNIKTTLVFSIYDLYMLKKETILQNESVTRPIFQYIERNQSNMNFIFILPIQMLTRTFKEKEIEGFLGKVKGVSKNAQLFYLPAIYGPWQPSTFLFQQVIFSELQKTVITDVEREWTKDALFIDDAMESISEIIETGKPGSYMLESGRKNHWFRCAEYLNVNENQANSSSREPLQVDNQLVRVSVKEVTPIPDSIKRQMEHVQRLYANRM